MRKISWLDNFAQEQASKLTKTASIKLAEADDKDVIVSPSDVEGANVGDIVTFDGKQYKVIDTDYVDEKGAGVILNEVEPEVEPEVEAEIEPALETEASEDVVTDVPLENPSMDPMAVATGQVLPTAANSDVKAQEYARTNPGDVYHYEIRDDVEQPKFEAEAQDTKEEIERENAVDRTTVDGKYTTTPSKLRANTVAPIVEQTPAEVPEVPVETTESVPEIPEVVEDVVPEEDEKQIKAIINKNRILKRILASK